MLSCAIRGVQIVGKRPAVRASKHSWHFGGTPVVQFDRCKEVLPRRLLTLAYAENNEVRALKLQSFTKALHNNA